MLLISDFTNLDARDTRILSGDTVDILEGKSDEFSNNSGVIPHEMREKHGDRYRVVELKDRIGLLPLKEDPIEGLRDAVGDVFDEKSIEEINL